MRPTDLLIAAALTAAMSSVAAAQTPAPPTPAGQIHSGWLASGFIGSNFGTNSDNFDMDGGASLDYGAQLAYLWHGSIGGEFIADFAPNIGDNVFFANEPQVSSYMGNIIAAIPLSAGRIQPYMSGGAGVIQLSVDLFDDFSDPANISTFSSSNSTAGANVGGGFMAFADHFGIRADVRWYKAFSDRNDLTLPLVGGELINQTVLDGLGFWRGNVGLAVRW